MTKHMRFPFTAILGQDTMKNALIYNVVNPNIGGALISGEKGTAKSTMVRALGELLEDITVVELPLSITEDNLVGGIDLKHAINDGERRFDPGLLHRANGNLLYIDEVNLLADHIIDALLTVHAAGENIVERDGLSVRHEARFVLIGSMNPEEGKLRPQFLDRFGLYAEVSGCAEPHERAEIVRRRIQYESSPRAFCDGWVEEQTRLRTRIQIARQSLSRVTVTEHAMILAAKMSDEAHCAGQRAEIVIVETAKAIAALDGRVQLNADDLKKAAALALPHRMRTPPPNQMPETEPPVPPESEQNPPEEPDQAEAPDAPAPDGEILDDEGSADDVTANDAETDLDENDLPPPREDVRDEVDEAGDVFTVKPWISPHAQRVIRRGSGRRSLVKTTSKKGRFVKARTPSSDIRDIAFGATFRAAAPHQVSRDKQGRALSIHASDIRVKVRQQRTGNTILFTVDASGSMGAQKRMSAVKGAVLSLLTDAYQKRDKVGMVAFRKNDAELLLGITRSVELAQKRLRDMPTGGRTPLAEGLKSAHMLLRAARMKDEDILPVLVLITDGRANAARGAGKPVEEALTAAHRIAADGIKCIVIDTERDFVRLKLSEKIAEALRADCLRIEELSADALLGAVDIARKSG